MYEIFNEILDGYRDEMIEELQNLVRIKSVTAAPAEGDAPFGKEVQKALDHCLALGEEKGFECVNFQNHAIEINLGDAEESVGVMTHLDVVPEGKGWNFPPYEGEIHDGKLYARGAVDDKGALVAAFYACLAIKESGLPLSKKIKHIVGANEENGTFPCMQHYKKVGNIPSCGIVPDSWFPVAFAEKGILTYAFRKIGSSKAEEADVVLLRASGGEAVNVVAPFAKAVFKVNQTGMEALNAAILPYVKRGEATVAIDGLEVTVTTIGKSAHASTPEIGVNAIGLLLQLAKNLNFAPADICGAIKMLASQVGHDCDGTGLNIKEEDHTGPLTNNIGLLTYEEDLLEVKMNIRSPITYTVEKMEIQLKAAAEKSGMEYERLSYNPHFYVEPDSELVQLLVGVYQEMTGDTQSKPKAHGGGSYARIFKNFIPFGPSFQGEELVFHKQDEHIACDRLVFLSKIYAQALYALAK